MGVSVVAQAWIDYGLRASVVERVARRVSSIPDTVS